MSSTKLSLATRPKKSSKTFKEIGETVRDAVQDEAWESRQKGRGVL